MRAGGYPERHSAFWFDRMWYYCGGLACYTTDSWWYAKSLYAFLVTFEPLEGHPGGVVREQTKGARADDKYNQLAKGDLLFFDWTDDGKIDHVRVEVGWGTPSATGYRPAYNNSYWTTGDWADQHTEPRYHDFWNGYYHMTAAERASVRIYQAHINPNN